MTAKPQDDLTAERAARREHFITVLINLVYQSTDEHGTLHDHEGVERDVGKYLDRYAAQTLQEALREARDYALACVAERNKQAFELTKTVLNDPRAVWLGCKASEAERIAEWIDRLASEGG